ncbi:transposase [bacterium]|nr:MAG: transposase [bacterium]
MIAPVLRNATRQPGPVPRRAIFYVLRTGCQWRFLPVSYPNWKTVYSCLRRWSLSRWSLSRWSLNGTWD